MFGLVSEKKYQEALRAIRNLEEELDYERAMSSEAVRYTRHLRETRFLPDDFCKFVEYMKPTTYGPICSMMKKYMDLMKDKSPAAYDMIRIYRAAYDEKHKGDKK